jgi:hypothetical protein
VEDLRRQGVECTLDQDGGLGRANGGRSTWRGSWMNGSVRVP